MLVYLVGILIIKFEYQSCEVVVLVEGIYKFLTDERQLESKIILRAGMKLVHKSRNGDFGEILETLVAIYRKVHDCEKCVSINVLHLTDLPYSLVAEAQIDAKGTETLQNIIIILDKRNKLIICFIKFLTLHNYLFYIIRCKISNNSAIMQ